MQCKTYSLHPATMGYMQYVHCTSQLRLTCMPRKFVTLIHDRFSFGKLYTVYSVHYDVIVYIVLFYYCLNRNLLLLFRVQSFITVYSVLYYVIVWRVGTIFYYCLQCTEFRYFLQCTLLCYCLQCTLLYYCLQCTLVCYCIQCTLFYYCLQCTLFCYLYRVLYFIIVYKIQYFLMFTVYSC